MPQASETAARLHAAAIHLLRHVRRDDPAMGLSPARASVLSVLVFAGPRTITELAAAEQVAVPTITKLINGLERDGYVRRRPSPQDGRSIVVRASARARRTLAAGRQRRLQNMLELFEALPDQEWQVLERAATVLERVLQDQGRTATAQTGR